MRVLFLLRTLTVGGIEPHLMALGLGLMQQGCTIAVASDGGIGNHSRGPEWFEAAGIPHFRIGFPKPGERIPVPFKACKSLWTLHSVVKEFQPDIIHVHYRSTSVYARVMQAVHGTALVSTLHMTDIPCTALHRMVSFWGVRTIAISTEVREYLTNAFGVDEGRIRMVHNGADDSFFRPPVPEERAAARAQLNLPPDAKVIAMLARMSFEKGHDVLLNAMAALRAAGHEVTALLAGVSISGDTSWRDEMKRRAADLRLTDHVRILGFSDSRRILWASDASVLPSRQEGFPMAVVESMLCGLAPIRTPAAGARDQISDGEDGFIIPLDDHIALSDRLQRLFENDELRARLGRTAMSKARSRFSASTMVTKTLKVYREALHEMNGERQSSKIEPQHRIQA